MTLSMVALVDLRIEDHRDLASWAGVQNDQERLVEDGIDVVVLVKLREAAP